MPSHFYSPLNILESRPTGEVDAFPNVCIGQAESARGGLLLATAPPGLALRISNYFTQTSPRLQGSPANQGNVRCTGVLGSASVTVTFLQEPCSVSLSCQRTPTTKSQVHGHQCKKRGSRAVTIWSHKRISGLTRRLGHVLPFESAHPKNTHHTTLCTAHISWALMEHLK